MLVLIFLQNQIKKGNQVKSSNMIPLSQLPHKTDTKVSCATYLYYCMLMNIKIKKRLGLGSEN